MAKQMAQTATKNSSTITFPPYAPTTNSAEGFTFTWSVFFETAEQRWKREGEELRELRQRLEQHAKNFKVK